MFVSSKEMYYYLYVSGYWVLILDVKSRQVSLFKYNIDVHQTQECRIFDSYRSEDIVYIHKSHRVDYVATYAVDAVDRVVQTMSLFTTLISRVLIAFPEQCAVNILYIVGCPCPEYRSLSNRCKVCWLHNYVWDESTIENCVLYHSIDNVENTCRQGDVNVCSYDDSRPLLIPQQSMCYILHSDTTPVNVVCDRAAVMSHTNNCL
jgi:hypothetical protein